MSEKNKAGDFSQGSLLENILRLAGPMTVALFINVLYSVVDRMYIGHLAGEGRLALTGIGLTAPLLMIISAFQSLCSAGGAPLFSIARGEGDDEKAGYILGNAYCLLLIIGACLTLLGYIFIEPILRLTGASADTFKYADEYVSIYLAGTVFVTTGLGMNSFINAQGFAKTGMLTVLLGAVANIILDPIFIFGFNMGVRGAALATVISQLLSAVWVFLFLTGGRAAVRLKLKYMSLKLRLIGRMAALGMAGFTMSFTNSAVSFAYNTMLGRLGGDTYIAVMTVINSLREVVFMPCSGITEGAKPVLGFNYGAKNYGRVREGIKLTTLLCVAYTFLIWAVMLLFPEVFIKIFNNSPEILTVGRYAMRAYFSLFVLMTFQMVGQNTFVSLGKSKQAVFFSLLRKAIILIPLIILMPGITGLGAEGVFWAEPVSELIGATACYMTMYFTIYRKLTQ
jgi:putative MATE family efflux protein